jgi:hypothetical protein
MKLKVVNGLLVVESFENFVPRNANRGKKSVPRTRPTVQEVLNLGPEIKVEKEEVLEEHVLEVKEKEIKDKSKEKKNARDGDGATSKTASDSS